ncbi:MAG: ATP-binding cassette domain-containing protein [Bacteroidota bacterium]
MNQSDFLLDLRAITKIYAGHRAVHAVSLHVPRGKIYGLLGPNGAGKTSIIRMITGITAPDEGEIYFDGKPLDREHVRAIGYMPEERGLYKKVKVLEQITYLLSLKGMHPKAARSTAITWLDRLGLKDWAKRNTNDLSKGMQQKVQFISTVAHEPKLLILDEPFSGLDPVNAKLIESEILRLRDNGTTIIFSTHRMEQVEELCDYIGLMNHGALILEDEITEVRKQFQRNQYRLEFVGDTQWLKDSGLDLVDLKGTSALIQMTDGQETKALMRLLLSSPLEILKVELYLPRLNDIFIELVGKNAQPVMQSPETFA